MLKIIVSVNFDSLDLIPVSAEFRRLTSSFTTANVAAQIVSFSRFSVRVLSNTTSFNVSLGISSRTGLIGAGTGGTR